MSVKGIIYPKDYEVFMVNGAAREFRDLRHGERVAIGSKIFVVRSLEDGEVCKALVPDPPLETEQQARDELEVGQQIGRQIREEIERMIADGRIVLAQTAGERPCVPHVEAPSHVGPSVPLESETKPAVLAGLTELDLAEWAEEQAKPVVYVSTLPRGIQDSYDAGNIAPDGSSRIVDDRTKPWRFV